MYQSQNFFQHISCELPTNLMIMQHPSFSQFGLERHELNCGVNEFRYVGSFKAIVRLVRSALTVDGLSLV